MRRTLLPVLVAAICSLCASSVEAEIYTIDPAHSSVTFQIRHFFSKVSGRFNDFSGVFDFDPKKPESCFVDSAIRVESIDTGNAKRDQDLRSNNFFNVAEYPTITFASKKVERTGEDSGKITGDLIIHG